MYALAGNDARTTRKGGMIVELNLSQSELFIDGTLQADYRQRMKPMEFLRHRPHFLPEPPWPADENPKNRDVSAPNSGNASSCRYGTSSNRQ